MDSLPNFCSQSYLAQFQQYRCIELGAQAGEQTLPEVCEKLIGSMSAFIHNGAVCEYHFKVHHWYTQDSISCYCIYTMCICINQQLATVITLEHLAHHAVNSVDSVNANLTLLAVAVIPVLLWHTGLDPMAAQVSHILSCHLRHIVTIYISNLTWCNLT